MRLPQSLQGRLVLTIAIGVAVLWIISAFIAEMIIRDNMNRVFDSALEETGQRILPLAVQELLETKSSDTAQLIPTLRTHDEFLTYVVRDRDGHILLQSHDTSVEKFPPFEATGFTTSENYIFYHDAALGGAYTITIAEPLAHRNEAALDTLLALGLPLFFLLPLTIGVIWLFLHITLGPLRSFRDELSARSGHDLTAVKANRLPTEISPVADAINALLARLHSTIEAERSFAANAAHELRTPVAAALAQTQRLQAEALSENTRARADNIETALKRLNRMSEKLMQMARAEGASLRVDPPQDLAKVLRMVVHELAYSDAGDQIELTLPAAPVLSKMDPDAFAIAARNLLENALRHGDAETPINVALISDGTLKVANASPVIAAETLKNLTRRFVRQDRSKDGSGLGLSIVQVIAEGGGGTLELHSPASGRADGFEAVFRPTSRQ